MHAPTLDDVHAQLNITSSDDDVELQAFLDAAVAVVEAKVGPLSAKSTTETVRTRGPRLLLNRLPVQSVTSLVATAPGTLTYATADLTWNGPAGTVWLRNGGSLCGEWIATYTAGLADVPANLSLATLIIVGHLWETQRGRSQRPGLLSPEDGTAPLAGFAIPNRAAELMAAHLMPGVA